MPKEEMVQVTPEEIIHLLLEEMVAGMSPSFYSNLVPSVFDISLYIDDLERLGPLESRIRDEAVRALNEKLHDLNKAAEPRLRMPLSSKKKVKKYATLGEWAIQFHENTDDDARDNPLIIHSSFPFTQAAEDRAGTQTERVTKRRSDGQTTSTATLRSGNLDTKRAAGIVYARLAYQDDSGPQTFQMTKELIKIGRGSADHWVDLKLNAKKDVSREHVQIRRDGNSGRFFIKDLSSFGTTVNGKRVPPSIQQVDGAEVDRNLEVPLPAKAEIGLAGVLSIDFRAAK
jgi:hypothetical protein